VAEIGVVQHIGEIGHHWVARDYHVNQLVIHFRCREVQRVAALAHDLLARFDDNFNPVYGAHVSPMRDIERTSRR